MGSFFSAVVEYSSTRGAPLAFCAYFLSHPLSPPTETTRALYPVHILMTVNRAQVICHARQLIGMTDWLLSSRKEVSSCCSPNQVLPAKICVFLSQWSWQRVEKGNAAIPNHMPHTSSSGQEKAVKQQSPNIQNYHWEPTKFEKYFLSLHRKLIPDGWVILKVSSALVFRSSLKLPFVLKAMCS